MGVQMSVNGCINISVWVYFCQVWKVWLCFCQFQYNTLTKTHPKIFTLTKTHPEKPGCVFAGGTFAGFPWVGVTIKYKR